MDYDLDRYGFKKMSENWYFHTDNSGIMHICNPKPNKTGDFPTQVGVQTPEGNCSECGTKIAEEYVLLFKLQLGFGGKKGALE